jgi:hypothetical protein
MTGGYADVFAVAAAATEMYGYSPGPSGSVANRIDFVVTVHPTAALTGEIDSAVPDRSANDLSRDDLPSADSTK